MGGVGQLRGLQSVIRCFSLQLNRKCFTAHGIIPWHQIVKTGHVISARLLRWGNKFSCIVVFNHDILSDNFNRLSFVTMLFGQHILTQGGP